MMSHTIIVTPRKRPLNPVQRRALQLLASSPYGATAVLTLSRGTSTAGHETVKAGRLRGYARHRAGATEITETRHRLLDVSGAMSPRMQITWMFPMAPKMLATKW